MWFGGWVHGGRLALLDEHEAVEGGWGHITSIFASTEKSLIYPKSNGESTNGVFFKIFFFDVDQF